MHGFCAMTGASGRQRHRHPGYHIRAWGPMCASVDAAAPSAHITHRNDLLPFCHHPLAGRKFPIYTAHAAFNLFCSSCPSGVTLGALKVTTDAEGGAIGSGADGTRDGDASTGGEGGGEEAAQAQPPTGLRLLSRHFL